MSKAGKVAAGAGGMLLMGGGGLVVVALLAVGGVYFWATGAAHAALHTEFEAHEIDFPVPFPLSDEEVAELKAEKAGAAGDEAEGEGEAPAEGEEAPDPLAGVDLEALALERAIERGKHYANGRYLCVECHGKDLAGGIMIDDGAMGLIQGPNITKGGRTKDYTPAKWDQAVRHGINKDGLGTFMPIGDFKRMSDRELSDIVAYVESLPPSDAEQPRPELGPLSTMLLATGNLVPEVNGVDHFAAHEVQPPAEGVTPEFGKHLAQVCVGCHRDTLNGGPIAIGPPDWPPAGNLTMHEDGLAGWSADDFRNAMRSGKRPDGTEFAPPMTLMTPYANEMTDTELDAMFAFLQSMPPTPTGE